MNLKITTVVGNKVAFALISIVYGCVIIAAFFNSQLIWIPILAFAHFGMDLFLVMGKAVPSRISLVKFFNESAMAMIVGWLMLLIFVFASAAFVPGDDREATDKSFGIAFGAGVGLLTVCGPCAMVALIYTSYLTRMNAPPTPFFGDD